MSSHIISYGKNIENLDFKSKMCFIRKWSIIIHLKKMQIVVWYKWQDWNLNQTCDVYGTSIKT